jgi:hypothetical protein
LSLCLSLCLLPVSPPLGRLAYLLAALLPLLHELAHPLIPVMDADQAIAANVEEARAQKRLEELSRLAVTFVVAHDIGKHLGVHV